MVSEHRLRLPVRVAIGSVEKIDAGIQRHSDHGCGIRFIHFTDCSERARADAKRHGTESETRDDQTAVAKFRILHAYPPAGNFSTHTGRAQNSDILGSHENPFYFRS